VSNASRFRLYQGDAIDLLKSLPSASIDMIDTDVAYESLEKHRAVGTTTRLKESDGSSNEWFEIFRNARFPEFFEESYRVLKKNAHLYFFCDGETSRVAIPIAEAAGFTFWNELVWVKTKGISSSDTLEKTDLKIGMGYHYRRTKEYVLFFEKGKRKVNDLGISDVLPFPPVRNGYPTEKPVELHKVLIGQSTQPGEIVCDPFMGSGSAGNGAVRLGRSFVGGDLKEKSVALARRILLGTGAQEDPNLIPPRGDEPEPAPKKARAKKPKDTTPEPPEPTQTEGYLSAIADAGADHAEQLGSITEVLPGIFDGPRTSEGHLRVGSGILEVLDALGVPHVEAPRQMFEVEVSDAPLPAMEGPGIVAQLEELFAHTQTEGYLAAIADEKSGAQPKLDGGFPTGPLPGGPTKHLPQPDLVSPPRPPSCPHGEPRSACVLCRARR
jgi:site-specific DNA-methyltransferase (adenine-specific)